MKLMFASDIHGSALYCERMLEACRREYEGYSAQFDRDRCMDRMEQMLFDAANSRNAAVKG